MTGRITADARALRAFARNAASFQTDDESRPQLMQTLLTSSKLPDGRIALRSVSSDSYGMLVQRIELGPAADEHVAFDELTIDMHAVVKAIPARKGDAVVEFRSTFADITAAGAEVPVSTNVNPYPHLAGNLDVEPEVFDPVVFAGRGDLLARVGSVVDPHADRDSVGWAQCGTTRPWTESEPSQEHRPVLFTALSGASSWSAIALIMPFRPTSETTIGSIGATLRKVVG